MNDLRKSRSFHSQSICRARDVAARRPQRPGDGFELDLTGELARELPVPVIASGGAGRARDFVDLFTATEASAALAASIFHDGSWTSDQLKAELARAGVPVRT